MRVALLALSLMGCTTHNRLTAAGTLDTDGSGVGGVGTLSTAVGGEDDAVMVAAALSGGGGSGLGRGSVLVGVEGHKLFGSWGGRLDALVGPAFVDATGGGLDATVESRGAISMFRLFEPTSTESETSRYTVGLEVFVSTLGVSGETVLVGAGLSVGRLRREHRPTGMMARRRHPLRDRAASR